MNFFNIKIHTDYSLLEAVPSINEYILKAKEKKQSVLGILDNNCFGILEFYYLAIKNNIKPLIGLEVNVKGIFDDNIYTLSLIAKNEEGIKEIYRISTISTEKAIYDTLLVDIEDIEKNCKNIYVLSSGFKGEITKNILELDLKKAKKIIEIFKEKFNDFYLELPLFEMEEIEIKSFEKIALESNIKYILTSDVYYLNKEDKILQKIFSSIKENTKLEKSTKHIKKSSFHFKTYEEITGIYENEIEKIALENLKELVDRIDIKLNEEKLDFPNIEIHKDLSEREYIESIIDKNFDKKYKENAQEARKRLKYELDIIEKMGYIKYFLIVYDFIKFAKNNNIYVGPGRGSAAGSITSYLLDITEVDPLKYDLIFERFLNPHRISMPDIDIDIEQERRNEVIEYLKQKYNKRNVSQIITFSTYKPKLAIRDIARVFSITDSEIKYILKKIDDGEDLESMDVRSEHKHIIDFAKKIYLKPKNTSTHAAGVIISKEDLGKNLPLWYNKGADDYQAQYPAEILEKLGYLKMDILGLKNLNIVKKTIEDAKIDIDIYNMPYSEKAFEIMNEGDTLGIFQCESRGITSLIKNLKLHNLEDISLLLALYRPGPLNSGYIDKLIDRKNNNTKFQYFHEDLEEILKPTYGIIVYQEQVMQIARKIAGYSLGEADELRKAIGKKNQEVLNNQRIKFIEKASIDKEIAEKIYDLIEKFGNYGFNKAHSISYAMITYQTAYLKANYPQEFYSSLLSIDLKDEKKLMGAYKEAIKRDIKILSPSVNKSFEKFVKEGKNIRMPFSSLKELSENTALKIVKEREKGDFKDFKDFIKRTSFLNKSALESLILSGIFDEFNINRNTLYTNLNDILKWNDKVRKVKNDIYTSLFLDSNEKVEDFKFKMVEEFDILDIIKYEFEIAKISLSAFKLIENSIYDKFMIKNKYDLGYIISKKDRITKKNEMMSELTMITKSGIEKFLIFPKDYTATKSKLSLNSMIFFENIILNDDKKAIKNIKNTKDFDFYTIYLNIKEDFNEKDKLQKIIKENEGNSEIYIYYKKEKIVKKKLKSKVKLSEKFLDELVEVLGEENIKINILE